MQSFSQWLESKTDAVDTKKAALQSKISDLRKRVGSHPDGKKIHSELDGIETEMKQVGK